MSISKRNPLLRQNQEIDLVVGNLGEEMKDQQLSNVDGGTHTTPYCAVISLTGAVIASAINLSQKYC